MRDRPEPDCPHDSVFLTLVIVALAFAVSVAVFAVAALAVVKS